MATVTLLLSQYLFCISNSQEPESKDNDLSAIDRGESIAIGIAIGVIIFIIIGVITTCCYYTKYRSSITTTTEQSMKETIDNADKIVNTTNDENQDYMDPDFDVSLETAIQLR